MILFRDYRGNNTLDGGDGNDKVYGGLGSDSLIGGLGNDVLQGFHWQSGLLELEEFNNTLNGGEGDDIYYISNAADIVIEEVNPGTDTIYSSVANYTAANVEKILFNLVETAGNDILEGGMDNDTIQGGDGEDSLVGGLGDDALSGDTGNDTLDGGESNDTLTGGTGNDTYLIDSTSDVINENLNAGTDTVASSFTYTLSSTKLENLTLTGTNALNGTGNSLANVLSGNAANNILNGGAGIDSMQGGAGNDWYVIDNSSDAVIESTDAGIDRVYSSATYSLTGNIEQLLLTGVAAINGAGNDLNNYISGNSVANLIEGRIGNDSLLGVAGDDTLTGSEGNDTLDGGAGIDNMEGGAGNDWYIMDNANDVVSEPENSGTDRVYSPVSYSLSTNVEQLLLTGAAAIDGIGNDLANLINGNSAANVINGGIGNDTLTGGAGADIFQFLTAGDIDRINDFTVADDTLELGNSIFSALTATGVLNQDWFKIGTVATDENDYLIYDNLTGKLYYDADGNALGGNVAVQIALIANKASLAFDDFMVV